MYTFFNYIASFWTVVVMNCIQPVNWQYCYKINEWLIPEINQGIQIYIDKNMDFLYKSERETLGDL